MRPGRANLLRNIAQVLGLRRRAPAAKAPKKGKRGHPSALNRKIR